MPLHVVRAGYATGIERAISKLGALVEVLEEQLGGSDSDSAARARRAFRDLDLQADIAQAVGGLYADGHYANAVEDACKVLESLVKDRSGRHDLSGKTLMQTVFSVNSPILRFSDLQSESDRNEQEGMMYLYAGVILAFRNPRAHGLVPDGPEDSMEYIAFVNLLAKALARTKRP